MPPACAMAIARPASVTVSMAAEISGMPSSIVWVSLVRVSTWEGRTSDAAGTSSTSSKVRASGIGEWGSMAAHISTRLILQGGAPRLNHTFHGGPLPCRKGRPDRESASLKPGKRSERIQQLEAEEAGGHERLTQGCAAGKAPCGHTRQCLKALRTPQRGFGEEPAAEGCQ